MTVRVAVCVRRDQGADKDKSGILDREEFQLLLQRADKHSSLPNMSQINKDGTVAPVSFDLAQAWQEIKKVPYNDSSAMKKFSESVLVNNDELTKTKSTRTSAVLLSEESDGSSLADREMHRKLEADKRGGHGTHELAALGLSFGVNFTAFEAWWKAKVRSVS